MYLYYFGRVRFLPAVLIINWRRWLTNRYIDEWLEHKTYYRLQMFGTATDNPDQRISEDVRLFVEYTLRFGIGILKAFTTFASFVVILYNLSGPLQFKLAGMDIHIPGYLVWTALLYSIIGTWLTYKVGNRLVGLNFVQQKYEADFRFAMMRMRENAESVAFYSGEGHEGSVFKKRFTLLLDNFWNIIKKQKQLTWLNSWYSQIAIIFPLVVAMPRYLAKEITLGGLMQISSAFGRVQESLSYFVDMYSSIAEWQAVVERLTGFGLHMQQVKQENAQKDLDRKISASEDIIAREMDVKTGFLYAGTRNQCADQRGVRQREKHPAAGAGRYLALCQGNAGNSRRRQDHVYSPASLPAFGNVKGIPVISRHKDPDG